MSSETDAWVVREVEANREALGRYIRRWVRDPDEAADIVQEVEVRLLMAARAGQRPDSTMGWMSRVARNLMIDAARRRSTAALAADRLVGTGVEPAADVEVLRRERNAAVTSVLAAAREPDRDAILMAAGGHRMREIAAHLGRSELATRALLSRARARVRHEMVAFDAV